jgi:plastocyanin
MARPGVIAIPVLLVLGAITGYLSYNLMYVQSTPVEGDYSKSAYYKPLSEASISTKPAAAAQVDKSQFKNVVTISILKGASVQGSPSYDPNPASAASDALITWVNNDSVPHTATSGKNAEDKNSGSLFDSSILEPGKDYSVPASKLGAGDHPYYCQVHPYMSGTVTVK